MGESKDPATTDHAGPPIPDGLCGVGGCVYIAGHASRDNGLAGVQVRHTWET